MVKVGTIRGLAREVDGLSPFPVTPGGAISCPGDVGASMYLKFRYPGAVRHFVVLLTGCPRLFAPSPTSTVYSLDLHLKHRLERLVPLK